MRVTYHPHATAELFEASRYYRRTSSSLSRRFNDAAATAIKAMQRSPTRWPLVEPDTRRYRLRKFPYAIYYQVFADHLYVVAAKHDSREPGYWQYRLTDEELL